MKIFGYRDEYNYGMTCGVIIADSIEELKKFLIMIIGMAEKYLKFHLKKDIRI